LIKLFQGLIVYQLHFKNYKTRSPVAAVAAENCDKFLNTQNAQVPKLSYGVKLWKNFTIKPHS